MTKKIFTKDEIPIADYLMSYKDALTAEFLNYHQDFLDGEFKKGVVTRPIYSVEKFISTPDAWKSTWVKYVFAHMKELLPFQARRFFPTAIKLTNEFGGDCPISSYSVLEANSIIHRHTGPENRDGLFLRIHIPLIVPEGDIFFEVGGEVIRWDDIFAFDNQTIHSAYNYSNKRRLVYLIDIRRSRLNMPAGRQFDVDRDERSYPPFDPEPYRIFK
jgi:hypothetical protein